MRMGSLGGRTAVVTGAGSGVGQGIALALAEEGARLCLVGRTAATLSGTAEAAGDRAETTCYVVDLTDDDGVLRLGEQLRLDVGPIDVLVHSAGVFAMGELETMPVAEVDRQYRTNVRAPYLLTQAVLPQLRLAHGQIVFINSSVGVIARAGVGAYAASKHALKAIADSLRDELNKDGMRVLSVYLGRTASPMQATIHAVEGKPYRPELLLQPSDVGAAVLNALLLAPTAEVTDISIRPMQKPPPA
jgi:short-subunit dehydrogenase